jgi:hypothetical protein
LISFIFVFPHQKIQDAIIFLLRKNPKETLINSALRANRGVAVVLKPLRTTKYVRALRSSRLALHPAKRISQHFLN